MKKVYLKSSEGGEKEAAYLTNDQGPFLEHTKFPHTSLGFVKA